MEARRELEKQVETLKATLESYKAKYEDAKESLTDVLRNVKKLEQENAALKLSLESEKAQRREALSSAKKLVGCLDQSSSM